MCLVNNCSGCLLYALETRVPGLIPTTTSFLRSSWFDLLLVNIFLTNRLASTMRFTSTCVIFEYLDILEYMTLFDLVW